MVREGGVGAGGGGGGERGRQRGNQTRCRAWLWGHKARGGVKMEKMEIAEGRVKQIEELETWLFMVLRYSSGDP